jgi:cyclopropane fatty-acyl-phospholipid synthase-like methyltransferase
MHKPFSEASERNKAPILQVLRERFGSSRQVLEIGSGTGQHAVFFAAAMPQCVWQCSDVAANLPGLRSWLDEAGLPNLPAPLLLDVDEALPALRVDAVYSANTLHIMSWPQVQRLFEALPRWLEPGGLLLVYGPFNYRGQFSSDSNARFDAMLRQDDARRGIRDFEAVDALAHAAGLSLLDDVAMPANNRCISWRMAQPLR